MRRFGAISGLRARLLPMNRLRLVDPTNVLPASLVQLRATCVGARDTGPVPARGGPRMSAIRKTCTWRIHYGADLRDGATGYASKGPDAVDCRCS